jgi:hypothetical protein
MSTPATIITSSFGSAVTPTTAGKPTMSIAGYNVSADSTTFIKEQDIAVYASGLRPSTRMYVFFDQVRISDFTTPATTDFAKNNLSIQDFHTAGSRGDATYTDANGRFAAIIHIPQASFFSGERQIYIIDVDNLNSISASTTKASYTFNAFNNNPPIKPAPPPPPPQPQPRDPLAQAIYVGSDGLSGADGIFVTSLDLYFQTKDSTQGVTIDIRQMQNGTPTSSVLPYSTISIPASSVNISNDASIATTITFKAPIFLKANNYYAITVAPDGNNPNYKLYTSVVGSADLTTSSLVFKNWGQGDLFTSTNGDTWNPIPNEFMKFNLRRAEFSSEANSSVSLVNKDYEFIYMSNTYGYFEQGEYAFQLASNIAFTNASASSQNLLVNANNYTVILQDITGTVTSGFTQFTNNTILVASNGSHYDTLFVNSVTNTSFMTIKNVPTFSGNVSVQLTPVGRVYNFDINKLDLTLEDSTATNNTFKFTQNSTIVGVKSRANTQIGVLRDRVINRFAPLFHNLTLPNVTIDLELLNTVSGTYGNTVPKIYSTSNMNTILDNEIVIASRSSEIANMNGRKSLSANLILSSNTSYVSPIVDIPTSSVIAYRNMITDQYYGENTKSGLAINKYISKTVTLASGLDSEDLVVYLDAYRPPNTTINVYGKFLSAADPEPFDSKDWTLLLNDEFSAGLYSDPTNLSDIKELKFSVPKVPFSTSKIGVITTSTSSNTVTGINTAFKTDIAVGDVIKIYSDSTKTTSQISLVTAIANNNSMSIDNNSAFATTAGSYERVDFPHTAFINENNGNILRYYSSSDNTPGTPYDTFITYAIKIVLASKTSYVVPRILNLRAIAVT